ncbi:elongin-C isoform X3 [Manacus candei]|uniref:elongin-C isoform X3 n=1 Tax=Manacus candei TaxID=415023 RepID=UPI002226CDD1|nr:elongin-C isoform X3 [Manacus candei]
MDGEEKTYGGCEGPDAMYVKLISSDGHEFIVKREHALTSGTIKAMLSGPGATSPTWEKPASAWASVSMGRRSLAGPCSILDLLRGHSLLHASTCSMDCRTVCRK